MRKKKTNKPLEVYLFNVGAGDHLVLKLPNESFGIFDFHYQKKISVNEPPILTYLKALKRKNEKQFRKLIIAFICLSHYDLDHILGLDKFLKFVNKNKLQVKNIWLAGSTNKDELKKLLIESINKQHKKIEKSILSSPNPADFKEKLIELENLVKDYNQKFLELEKFIEQWKSINNRKVDYAICKKELNGNIGSNFKAFCLAPHDDHIKDYTDNRVKKIFRNIIERSENSVKIDGNIISSIIYLTNSKLTLSFGGDAHKDVWNECMNEWKAANYVDKPINADFIKVSHHGSKKSSSSNIWKHLIKDKENVTFAISAGTKYGHPSSKTIKHIRNTCNDLNVSYSIYSTNICQDCINQVEKPKTNQVISIMTLSDWELSRNEIHKKLDSELNFTIQQFLQKNQTKFRQSKDSNSNQRIGGLFAYLFQYNTNTCKADTYKVISTNISPYPKCLFSNHNFKLECCS